MFSSVNSIKLIKNNVIVFWGWRVHLKYVMHDELLVSVYCVCLDASETSGGEAGEGVSTAQQRPRMLNGISGTCVPIQLLLLELLHAQGQAAGRPHSQSEEETTE